MIEVAQINPEVVEQVLATYSEEAVTQVLGNIAEAARQKWITLAGRTLTSSRATYAKGIQRVELSHLRASIALVGVVANLLENGMPETDMRDTLLGPHVPVTEPGQKGKRQGSKGPGHYYRAIPFRHQTPGTAGLHAVPMGKAYEGHEDVPDARKLGKAVYAAAKALGEDGGGTRSKPYSGSAYGKRLPEGLAPKLKEWHATDIYAGMIRQEKVYEDEKRGPQASYATFRMISTKVKRDPRHWVRPATEGAELGKQVAAHAARIAPASFAQYVEGLRG